MVLRRAKTHGIDACARSTRRRPKGVCKVTKPGCAVGVRARKMGVFSLKRPAFAIPGSGGLLIALEHRGPLCIQQRVLSASSMQRQPGTRLALPMLMPLRWQVLVDAANLLRGAVLEIRSGVGAQATPLRMCHSSCTGIGRNYICQCMQESVIHL